MKTEHEKERERVKKAVEKYLAEGGKILKFESDEVGELLEGSKAAWNHYAIHSETYPSIHLMPFDIKK